MSASETPKSRLETRSFPPVSTPAPPPPPRTHLLTSGSPCLCQSQSPHAGCWGKQGLHFQQRPGC
uniref:Uncharacterized protein n=1 Tax=Salarias fasciatus TaxID=181472 RepID=A0A672FPE8_SALFA